MANLNCSACEEIKQEVPSIVTDGLSNTMCTSLKNDTGLKASSGNDDCDDLNNLNDCLVGNMETEIDKHDVCDWKPFTKSLIGNLWTTLKAMICAICGLWTNVHNLWTTISSLCLKRDGNKIVLYSNLGDHCSVTDNDTKYSLSKNGDKIILTGTDGSADQVTDSDTWQPNTASQAGYVAKGDGHANQVWATNDSGVPAWRDKGTIDGRAFVKYYRDLGTDSDVPYWDNITDGFERTLDIYMDSHGNQSGTQVADRDYVVIISNCTNFRYFGDMNAKLTYYSSGDTRSVATIRSHQGQHPSIALKQYSGSAVVDSDSYFENFSWTNSGAVLLKAGEHIKVNFYVGDVDQGAAQQSVAPSARLHQFVLTWIPVAVQIN